MNPSFWQNKKVLITGHTGFKGAWLSHWLTNWGAKVTGLSMDLPTQPALFADLKLAERVRDVQGDIRNLLSVKECAHATQPEIVFHMAAQSLVRPSYDEPLETYATNVMGTANVLEVLRHTPSVRASVIITTDKCYENNEGPYKYRETDPMGGYDPYSSSKACAEIVTAAYRRSFTSKTLNKVATVRAGNVIGGGDWATARLVPDIIRAVQKKETLTIRYPNAIRPWQHVLEPLSGYLTLAENLFHDQDNQYTSAWNFGPASESEIPVRQIVDSACTQFADLKVKVEESPQPHEANWLALDSSKAQRQLHWQPRLKIDQALDWTFRWYKTYLSGGDIQTLTTEQIKNFESL